MMTCPYCGDETDYIRGERTAYCTAYFTVDSDGEEAFDEFGDHDTSDSDATYSCPNCSEELNDGEVEEMQAHNSEQGVVLPVAKVKHNEWGNLL